MLKKIVLMFICFTMSLSFAGCQKQEADGPYPQLSPMKKGEQVAVITTSMGVIKLRFFPQYAPKAVENFVTHSKDGYYNGVKFHRVMQDFMIQTGDPNGDGTGGESIWGGTFDLEVDSHLRHFRGAVAMANTGAPNSNGSQFYVVQNNKLPDEVIASLQEDLAHPDEIIGEDENGKSVTIKDMAPVLEEYIKNGGAYYLDFGYTVFAQVYEGMDVVDAIAAVEVALDPNDPNVAKPVEDIIIESIKIEKYKK